MKLQWSKKYIAMGLVAFLVVAASILFLLFLIKNRCRPERDEQGFLYLNADYSRACLCLLLNPILIFFEEKCFRKLLKKNLGKNRHPVCLAFFPLQ